MAVTIFPAYKVGVRFMNKYNVISMVPDSL